MDKGIDSRHKKLNALFSSLHIRNQHITNNMSRSLCCAFCGEYGHRIQDCQSPNRNTIAEQIEEACGYITYTLRGRDTLPRVVRDLRDYLSGRK